MLVDKKLIDEELDKYKLKFNRKKRKKIEESANYEELGKILNFLINNLHISKRSIEKCPSILYRKKSSIRNNYLFLEDKKIYNYNVETCLHILSVNEKDLVDTYNYVEKEFGYDLINKNTTILKIKRDYIKNINETYGKYVDKETLLGICICSRNLKEIGEIINICTLKNVKITSSIFKQPPEEVTKIIDTARNYNLEITGSMFHQKAKNLSKIVEYCKKLSIEPISSMFTCSFESIKEIIDNCVENGIELKGTYFRSKISSLDKIVEICEDNGITPSISIFKTTPFELERILEVCNRKKQIYMSQCLVRAIRK